MEQALRQLLKTSKKTMYILTSEDEQEWRESQSYTEAPYHFLYKAIVKAEKVLEDNGTT